MKRPHRSQRCTSPRRSLPDPRSTTTKEIGALFKGADTVRSAALATQELIQCPGYASFVTATPTSTNPSDLTAENGSEQLRRGALRRDNQRGRQPLVAKRSECLISTRPNSP